MKRHRQLARKDIDESAGERRLMDQVYKKVGSGNSYRCCKSPLRRGLPRSRELRFMGKSAPNRTAGIVSVNEVIGSGVVDG